jgi:translation initiation factor 2B subunit (eIF-2B alpha/beta/delta family)
MNELEQLREENERLKNAKRADDSQWRNELNSQVSRIETACASSAVQRVTNTAAITELAHTVFGKDSSPGLKGTVAILAQKMGLIQWVVSAITVAILAATVDRIINRPATCEGLEATAREAV